MTVPPLPPETAAGDSVSSSVAVPDASSASGSAAPRRWAPWVAGGIVVLVFVGLVVGTVVWALSRNSGSTVDPALRAAAFASAMKKAGVDATYPPAAVELTSLRISGSHPFSATFTPEEIAALLSTFTHLAQVSGSDISLRDVTLQLAGSDSLRLSTGVEVGGSAYSGSVTAPVAFSEGRVRSSGATAGSAEGFSLNGSQRAQITEALLGYFNSYLDAAPGLTVGSARLTADGIVVVGRAPDRIELP